MRHLKGLPPYVVDGINGASYNMACAAFGGAGMVWVMTSEDDERQDEGGVDGPRLLAARTVFAGGVAGCVCVRTYYVAHETVHVFVCRMSGLPPPAPSE